MAWALPVLSLGTKLDDESLKIAFGLRLDVPIAVEHTCVRRVGNVPKSSTKFQRS